MNCALSGEVPMDPVVSKTTGHLFEKDLITKYIEQQGKCPVTGQELSVDDLLPINSSKVVRPRPVSATSVPGLLALMQNEWDALMLETFTLKQHLDATRQELSQSLYQQDAACRVIARLVRERDEARAELSSQRSTIAQVAAAGGGGQQEPPAKKAKAGAGDMEVDGGGGDGDSFAVHMQAMVSKEKELSKQRKDANKEKKTSASSASVPAKEVLESFTEQASHKLHKTNPAGVTCLAVCPSQQTGGALVLTGGADKTAIIFNKDSGKQEATLSGHSKKIHSVMWHSSKDMVFTASADKTCKIWSKGGEGSWPSLHTLQHGAEVMGVALQATGDYIATATKNSSWSFSEIENGTCLRTEEGEAAEVGDYQCVHFHPDGCVLGLGTTNNTVRLWDLKAFQHVKAFEGHEGTVNAIAFSENGYTLASGSMDGNVKIWDLRKLKEVQTLTMGAPVHALSWDQSGTYLAAGGGAGAKVWARKGWTELLNLPVEDDSSKKSVLTGVGFGPKGGFLATSSMNRCVKFYGTTD